MLPTYETVVRVVTVVTVVTVEKVLKVVTVVTKKLFSLKNFFHTEKNKKNIFLSQKKITKKNLT